MKIFKKILIFIAAAGLLLSLVSFLLVKIFLPQDKVKRYIENYAKENFHREISFDKVKFNLIGVDLVNFALSERDSFAKGTFIKAKNLTVKVSVKPLFHKKIEVQTLEIDGMGLSMIKDKNGRFNFNDISTKKEQTPENIQNKAKDVKNDIPLKIYKLAVKDSTVLFKDELLNVDAEISGLNVDIKNFSFTETFPCDISFDLKYRQNKLDLSAPVKTETKISLNDLDFEKLSVEIISFETKYKDALIGASGNFKNAAKPDVELQITCKNVSDSTFADFFVSKTKFTLPSIDFLMKAVLDPENKSIELRQADIILAASKIKNSGSLDFSGEKLKYGIENDSEISLAEAAEFFPQYNFSGKLKSYLKLSEKNVSGRISASDLSFANQTTEFKNTGFKAIINSKENIILETASGAFNGGNFKAAGSYSKNSLNLNLKIDKLHISEPADKKEAETAKVKKSGSQDSKDFNINITADISAGEVDVPYITGKDAYIKVSLKSVTKDMKNSNGYIDCGISEGQITNTEKLAQNKFAKIFLMIFNSLNNNIKQSQKIDDKTKSGIRYDSLVLNSTFTNGKMTAKKIDFAMPITTVATSGYVDFKGDSINLKVNTGLYAVMKITGTVDNPKTSFDTAGTIGEILKDAQSGKSSQLGKKLDSAIKNIFGR